MEDGDQEVRGEEQHTFGGHDAAFLTPRLSILAGEARSYTAPQGDYSGGHDAQEEEPTNLLAEAEELQYGEDVGIALLREDMNDTEETKGRQQQQLEQHELNATEDGEATFDAGVFFVGQDDNGADNFDADGEEETKLEDDEVARDTEWLPPDEADSDDDEGNAATQRMDRATFPLSRVRELLKFHSDFSIVAKDAAVVAGEAVTLMLQDLARLAAAEAERHRRKRVTYADVARVVHYFDRYSFLTGAVPTVPAVASVAKAVAVAPATSSGAEAKPSRGVAREGMGRTMSKVTGNGGGGVAGMRQTKLRF
ncbi:uncharacterized protein Tco025E_07696 [Trypanosoma conorhini]|uniref:Transcription factor CBF/NF-Y/archaeal histone domain-containing protein n=1 Tax=Trypanosoma conorhini TaxID=83891 RepID=A0A3R7L1Q3_9TRYP|nr:uncharacterized protein Tco025E_07696 [Trypanosoma conorhini]RNF05827.1 hypothetical protein Tco025E_07696 [Trypanosoma conorhini]